MPSISAMKPLIRGIFWEKLMDKITKLQTETEHQEQQLLFQRKKLEAQAKAIAKQAKVIDRKQK